MAKRQDDIAIIATTGTAVTEILDDADTEIGVCVQLRGVDVVAANMTAACTLKCVGDPSVVSVVTEETGVAKTTISAADIDTLEAGLWDLIIAYWEGTITDGSDTHTWRHQQWLTVSNKQFQFPFDYSELSKRYRDLTKTCAIPSDQTNFWDQISLGLADLRDDIYSDSDDVRIHLIENPGDLRRLARAYALYEVCEFVNGFVQGVTNKWPAQIDRWSRDKVQRWKNVRASIAASKADWKTPPATTQALIDPVVFTMGDAQNPYGGGPL